MKMKKKNIYIQSFFLPLLFSFNFNVYIFIIVIYYKFFNVYIYIYIYIYIYQLIINYLLICSLSFLVLPSHSGCLLCVCIYP